MPTFTKSNSKYSLLKSFIVTLLFVVFMSKLISSVKEFCLMSATGTLLFPNLITSGDTVCYQKFWEGGILKSEVCLIHPLIPIVFACFCRLAARGPVVTCTNQACPISTFHLSCLKITKVPNKWFCPLCLKTPAAKNEKSKCKQTRDILDEALKLDFICTCKQKPLFR